jgi:phage FluMu protein Com
MTKVAQAIRCAKCKTPLPTEWILVSSPDQKCPSCGVVEQEVLMKIIEDLSVEAHDNVRMKVKDPALPGAYSGERDRRFRSIVTGCAA